MLSLCCVPNRGMLCCSVNNDKVKLNVYVGEQWKLPNSSTMWNGELHLDRWMLAGCKFIVMIFCLMNKEKALGSVLAITHVLFCRILYILL